MSIDTVIEYAVIFLRIGFGVWNLFFGLVFFFDIFGKKFLIEQPMGHGEFTPRLNQVLIDTHLFHVVKAIEIVVGLMLILNIGVPFALCVYFPITYVIFHTNLFLEDFKAGPAIAWIYLIVHLFLLWAYRGYFASMLVWDSQITPGISLL